MCSEIGLVRDGERTVKLTACSSPLGKSRDGVRQTSTGNRLEVELKPAHLLRTLPVFLLKYEGQGHLFF